MTCKQYANWNACLSILILRHTSTVLPTVVRLTVVFAPNPAGVTTRAI